MAYPRTPMIGRRFGRLDVVADEGPTTSRDTYYGCLCDCGERVVKRGKHLRAGLAVSCGCHARISVDSRFGRLTVIGDAPADRGKNRCYECRCDCGAEKVVRGTSLLAGTTKSCGCLHREGQAARIKAERPALIHGHAQNGRTSRTWNSWAAAIKRCTNPNNHNWPRYDGRGSMGCERWRNSFALFLHDMGERPPGRTLDRIDPDGNYEPGNCRWATPLQQRHNRSPG